MYDSDLQDMYSLYKLKMLPYFVSYMCVSLQDSQTDSGMVLASDELERFEQKHREAMLKK